MWQHQLKFACFVYLPTVHDRSIFLERIKKIKQRKKLHFGFNFLHLHNMQIWFQHRLGDIGRYQERNWIKSVKQISN